MEGSGEAGRTLRGPVLVLEVCREGYAGAFSFPISFSNWSSTRSLIYIPLGGVEGQVSLGVDGNENEQMTWIGNSHKKCLVICQNRFIITNKSLSISLAHRTVSFKKIFFLHARN